MFMAKQANPEMKFDFEEDEEEDKEERDDQNFAPHRRKVYKLIRDMSIRWNIACNILGRMLEPGVMDAIKFVCLNHTALQELSPADEDWEGAAQLVPQTFITYCRVF